MSHFKPGLLFVLLVLAGFPACASGIATTSLSTPTLTLSPRPTGTQQRPTFQWPTLIPSATTVVPTVPDDKRIIANIDLGDRPRMMAVGDGTLWVIAGDSIVRIDPQTDQVVGKPIPVGVPRTAILEAIVVGEEALWVSMVNGGSVGVPNDVDSVLRIDPQTGETLARIKVRRAPASLAYTPGFVWVANWGAHLVTKIDSKTNQIAGEPLKIGAAPYSMVPGDGSLWIVHHDDGTVTRIDPETNQILAEIVSHWEPHRLAFGENAVWVGNWHDLSVSRIDPQTNQFVGDPIPVGYAAGSIAAGDGNVWVTSDYRGIEAFPEAFPDHTILIRIDPNTNTVVDTIPLGGHPVDVEVTEGAVWVSIQHPDRVLKIQP
jgi:DNA-binding beta-propeller fold protein YncE